MQTVILAGGLGTRLMPLTKDRPKALVEVAGRPFADRQLALLKAMGASRIVYSVSHFADQLRVHVGDGSRFGLHVDYVEDGERPLGTGGAIRSALDAGLLEEIVTGLMTILFLQILSLADIESGLVHFMAARAMK